jgi:PAS domain S-box-containing protein
MDLRTSSSHDVEVEMLKNNIGKVRGCPDDTPANLPIASQRDLVRAIGAFCCLALIWLITWFGAACLLPLSAEAFLKLEPIEDLVFAAFAAVYFFYLVSPSIRAVGQSQKLADKRQQKFEAAFGNAATGMAIITVDGQIINANQKLSEILGVSALQTQGCQWKEFIRAQDWAKEQELLKQILKQEIKEFRHEFQVNPNSVNERWVEKFVSILPGLAKDTLQLLAVFTDISNRKAAEKLLQTSEARLGQATDLAQLGIFDYDLILDECNTTERCREIYGWPQDQAMRFENLLDAVHPEDRQQTAELFEILKQPDGVGKIQGTWRVVLPNGEIRWVESKAQAFFAGEGNGRRAVRVLGANIDVTEEKAQADAAKLCKQLFESASFGLAYADARTNTFVKVNRAFASGRGYEPEELIGQPVMSIYPDRLRVDISKRISLANDRGHLAMETLHRHKDGTEIPVLMELSVNKDEEGEPVSRIACCHDLTLLKRAELALHNERFIHSASIASLSEGLVVISNEREVLSINPAAQRILGSESPAVISKILETADKMAIHEDGSPFEKEELPYNLVLAGKEPECAKVVGYTRHDGAITWLHITVKSIQAIASELSGAAIVSLRDITDRKRLEINKTQLEKNLQKSKFEITQHKTHFNTLFANTQDGIMVVDLSRRLTQVNPAFSELFGYNSDELIGFETRILYGHYDDWLRAGTDMEEPRRNKSFYSKNYQFKRKSGEIFTGQMNGTVLRDQSGNIVGYIDIIRDISSEPARIKADAEARRLESLVQLTGAMAHDFNNILSVINANLQLAKMSFSFDEAKSKLMLAEQATDLGAKLNKRIMTFAERKLQHVGQANMNNIISGMQPLLTSHLRDSRVLENSFNLASDLWDVSIDRVEFESALLNLVLNSIEAMPDGGSLTISTENKIISGIGEQPALPAVETKYVSLIVSDTGHGMSAETAKNALEPYFTTKPDGTGLGLAMVNHFVVQAGGMITIDSREGSGTAVRIDLPAA